MLDWKLDNRWYRYPKAGRFLRLMHLSSLGSQAIAAYAVADDPANDTMQRLVLPALLMNTAALAFLSTPTRRSLVADIRRKTVAAHAAGNVDEFLSVLTAAHVCFPHLIQRGSDLPLLRGIAQFKEAGVVAGYRLGFVSGQQLHFHLGKKEWTSGFEKELGAFAASVDELSKRMTAKDDIPEADRQVVAALLRARTRLLEWDKVLPPKAPNKKRPTPAGGLPAPKLTEDGRACLAHQGETFELTGKTKVNGSRFTVLGAFRRPQDSVYRIAVNVEGRYQLMSAEALIRVIEAASPAFERVSPTRLALCSRTGILSNTRSADFVTARFGKVYMSPEGSRIVVRGVNDKNKFSSQVSMTVTPADGAKKSKLFTRPAMFVHFAIVAGWFKPVVEHYGAPDSDETKQVKKRTRSRATPAPSPTSDEAPA